MTTFALRIKQALESAKDRGLKVNKSSLAKACGVSPSSITDWVSGRAKHPRGDSLYKAAVHLGVSQQWLATGLGDMFDGLAMVIEEEHADDVSIVPIHQYDVFVSAGSGAVTFMECDESTTAYYKREWFYKNGINPGNCRRFKVVGDSMEPYLWDNDKILVDCSQNKYQDIKDGKVYVFMLNHEMRVKILKKDSRLGLYIESYNSRYHEEHMTQEELEQSEFVLIGRVRDRSGNSGL